MQKKFGELTQELQRIGTNYSSLNGMEYEECVRKFGADSVARLCRLLEAADSGWFVRGVWGDSAANLGRSIYSFDLSLRSLHCLAGARLRTVGQVAALTEAQLLRIKNLGRKSFVEIKELLSSLGLEQGRAIDTPKNEKTPAWWDVNLYLLLPIGTLRLVAPLIGEIEGGGIHFVADLATCTANSLVRDHKISLARIDQIERALLAMNIGLGERVPEWQRREVPLLRVFFHAELLEALRSGVTHTKPPKEALRELIASAMSLEEELYQLACWTCAEPGARIGMRYLGWDGKGGASLEETASEVGLTRERVRQIVSRIVDKLGPLALRPPMLVQAVEALCVALPSRAADVERRLIEQGIAKDAFRVEGLLTAAAVFGLEAPIVVRSFGKEHLLLRKGEEGDLDKLVQNAVELAASQGVARLSELSFDCDRELLRDVLEQNGSLAWLDGDREWFWAPRARANRLLSRVRQILTAVPEISLEQIRAALLWKERIADSDLPAPVLRALVERQPWCRCDDVSVMLTDETACTAARTTTEFCIFQVLARNGGAMYVDDFVEQCEARGVTAAAIGVLRSTSALIQFEGDICRLPGTAAPPAKRTWNTVGVPKTARTTQGSASILSGLSSTSLTFVEDASVQLLARATELDLGQDGRVWSLVELLLSADDFAQLRDWGRVGTVDFNRLGAKAHGSIGLVLTAYCMEIARHEATEGEMWPQVYQSLGPFLRQSLFSAPGQPRQRVRDAMEYACRRFQLRHVFGSEGAQAWLRTVYLQFGITGAGWKRLPWWLSGQGIPIAVHDLLREESPVYSDSFAILWHTLQEFRWGTLTRGEARSGLTDNPWIASVALDVALDLAASHREVERVTEAPVPENEAVLAPPRLSWRGEEPCFEITLARRLPDWMTAPQYVLVLGELARLRVVQNAEGDYEIDGGASVLAPEQSIVSVDLLNDGASVLPEPFVLEFYAPEEEIVAFDLATGRKLNVWEPIPDERSCALLCAPDIALSPPAIETRFMFGGQRLLSIYRRGIPQELMASLDGEPLWSPVEQAPQKASTEIELVARCRGGVWGESAPVEIQVDPEIHVRKLRIGQQVLRAIGAESGFVRFEPITLSPELDMAKHAVLETLRDGQLRRVPVRFETVPSHGAAVESGGKWQVLHETTSLDKADLLGRRLFVRPPAFFDGRMSPPEDWALVEGTNFCGRPRGVNREFHALLHGFGQSLELALGPYNQVGDQRIAIAEAVTNFGVIKSVVRSGDCWIIEFRHSVQSGMVRILAWTGSEIVDLPISAMEWDVNSCKIAFAAVPVTFGVAFEDVCVGTGLTERAPYSQLCSIIETGNDWRHIADCLRWFHLPLLDVHVRHSVASRIAGRECHTFCQWTGSGDSPIPSLRQEDANRDHWQYVLRRFFERWRPCPDEAGAVIRHFDLLTGDPMLDLEQCWERHDELLNLHPVLLAAIANLGMTAIYPTASQDERRIFLDMLRNVSLDLSRNAGEPERKRAEQKCMEEASASMSVNPAFIERSLLVDAQSLYRGAPVNTRNLRFALAVRPFRQWLAARLI